MEKNGQAAYFFTRFVFNFRLSLLVFPPYILDGTGSCIKLLKKSTILLKPNGGRLGVNSINFDTSSFSIFFSKHLRLTYENLHNSDKCVFINLK
jgi:hypothetical protein